MDKKRGARNLKKYNADRELAQNAALDRAIKKVVKLKADFRTRGALAEWLSDAAGIHRTTLLRNKNYRLKVDSCFLLKKEVIEPKDTESASPEVLQFKVIAMGVEIASLKKKIRDLEERLDIAETKDASCSGDSSRLLQESHSFSDTAAALKLVIDRYSDFITVDYKNCTIEDRSARPSERIVVPRSRASAFVHWLEDHEDLLFGGTAQVLPGVHGSMPLDRKK